MAIFQFFNLAILITYNKNVWTASLIFNSSKIGQIVGFGARSFYCKLNWRYTLYFATERSALSL